MLSVLFSLDGPSDVAVQTERSGLNLSPGVGGEGEGEEWSERGHATHKH